jgi:hypothetical protein
LLLRGCRIGGQRRILIVLKEAVEFGFEMRREVVKGVTFLDTVVRGDTAARSVTRGREFS